MKLKHVGVRVARNIHSAEHALDNAILEVNRLVATMVECRAEAGLAAEVGQDALEASISTLTALTAARQSVIRAHSGLAAVAENQGIPYRMDGPYEEKIRPQAALRQVA